MKKLLLLLLMGISTILMAAVVPAKAPVTVTLQAHVRAVSALDVRAQMMEFGMINANLHNSLEELSVVTINGIETTSSLQATIPSVISMTSSTGNTFDIPLTLPGLASNVRTKTITPGSPTFEVKGTIDPTLGTAISKFVGEDFTGSARITITTI